MITRIQSLSLKLIAALALFAVSFASPASAATTSNRLITSIELTSSGSAYVHFDGNLSGATCSNKDMLYFDTTTNAGKSFLTAATSAYLAAKLVNITFSSAGCVSSTHTMNWMHVHN